MLTRSTFLALAVALAMAAPADAQTSASGRAMLVVGELMTLNVLSASAPEAPSSPVRVEVAANRTWQLNVMLDGADGRSWSAGAVARGGPGRTPVELNYEELVAVAGAAPGSTLRLTLSAL